MRGLFLEGPIFGGAYVRKEICALKSIRLALFLVGYLPFFFCFTLFLRAIPKYKPPPRGLYWFGGGFNGGFFCVVSLEGLFLEGLIFGILRYAVSSVSIA